MMYNPQLDTFLCVVEAESFSKSAEKLYISPPAVIKQINSFFSHQDPNMVEWFVKMVEERKNNHLCQIITLVLPCQVFFLYTYIIFSNIPCT